jgi:hypothetical protein
MIMPSPSILFGSLLSHNFMWWEKMIVLEVPSGMELTIVPGAAQSNTSRLAR